MKCSASARLTDSLASQRVACVTHRTIERVGAEPSQRFWADNKQLTSCMETVAKGRGTLPEWPCLEKNAGIGRSRLSPLHESH